VDTGIIKNGFKMNIEDFRKYCLSVKGAIESISLQNRNILVFKVMEKVFVYIPLEPQDGIFKAYLKCNPERSVELREKYDGINPDDFKTLLWNWVTLESDVPDDLIKELIQHSADEVILKLSKKKQEEYRNS
jgi:predicted DNA-binding protein (MmcQ/YjbR family)